MVSGITPGIADLGSLKIKAFFSRYLNTYSQFLVFYFADPCECQPCQKAGIKW